MPWQSAQGATDTVSVLFVTDTLCTTLRNLSAQTAGVDHRQKRLALHLSRRCHGADIEIPLGSDTGTRTG